MSKPSITNCPNTFFRKVHSFSCWLSIESRGTVVLYYQIQFACVQIRHTPLSGGYCGEVPPLPIPNREVKLTCADGTAMQCGRVGSRLLSISEASITKVVGAFLYSYSSAFLSPSFFPQIEGRSSFYLLPFYPFTFLPLNPFYLYIFLYSHSLHCHFLSKIMANLL